MVQIARNTEYSKDVLEDVLANSLAEGIDDETLDLLKRRSLRAKYVKTTDSSNILILGAQELPRDWPEITALGGIWIEGWQGWVIPAPKCTDKLSLLCACLRVLLNDRADEYPTVSACRARKAYNDIYNDTGART